MFTNIIFNKKKLIKNEYVYFFDFFLHLCPCDNCLCLLHLMGLL